MSMQPIGHVDLLRERHESLVSRMSPAAKHAAFPNRYARPLPMPSDLEKLRTEIASKDARIKRLLAKQDELETENKRLTELLARMQLLTVLPQGTERIAVSEVVAAFCVALKAEKYETKEGPITLASLQSARRGPEYAEPRQVGMWLCKRICTHASSTQIGKAFGGRDHTTALAAFRRAPEVMAKSPLIQSAADRVLGTFVMRAAP